MAQTPPIIQNGMLTYQQDGSTAQVVVGSSGWYSWLETASTFTFRSAHGSFTAHKERAGNRRGRSYWRAYTWQGKLHRAYLGQSEKLTFERLSEVAARLVGQRPADDDAKANPPQQGETALRISKGTQDGQASLPLAPTSDFVHPNEHARKRASRRDLPTGTITLLFTDIEGSTHLLRQLGDRYAEVLAECRHLLRRAFHEYHGHEVDTQGDAFFVAFTRATDAVAAAVDAQRTLARYAWPEGVAVRVRMGLHIGEPELTSVGYTGLDVHHAARIMAAGHGGQVLLSQTTRDLVEHDLPEGVSLRDLGAHHLKDLQHPSHLFQLVIVGLPADFPPLRTLDVHPNNLPVQPTPFIGREKEVAGVAALLSREHVRLLTLSGPGGTGKTRLGLQVADELSDRFAEGVFFVNLAPIRDPEFVLPAIAQVLGIKETSEQSLLDLLQASLREKHVLLLLDNFEQVVRAALHVAALLAACPQLKIMVTSRMALHVRAEHEFVVPPLSLPDPARLPDLIELAQYEAVTLFVERAQAIKADFALTEVNARAIAEICVRLDGLPLAIELAAARIKLLPPQALLKRLSHRLEVLTGGAQDLPDRQQTLRNTIAWSYDLLAEQEQRLFRWLSIFVGGCTLEAAEALCQTGGEPTSSLLEGVASLLDKSLVQQTEREGEEARLVMLETLREFGLESLQGYGELEAARGAHARYYLELAEQAEPELRGPEQVTWLHRLEQEYGNLRAALEWGLEEAAEQMAERRELALRLSAALEALWLQHGYYREARTFLERTLARSEGESASLRARVLQAAAYVALLQGDHDRAEVLAKLSLALCRELDNTRGIARSLFLLGRVAWTKGKTAEALALYEERVRLMRQIGEPGEVAEALGYLADHLSSYGEYARGQALFEEALGLFRKAGNELMVGIILVQSAMRLCTALGDAATIRQRLQEGQALIKKVGNRFWSALSSWIAAFVALSEGETARAYSLAMETLAIHREMDSRWFIANTLFLLGRVEAQRGELTAARSSYQESLTLCQELGEKFITPFNLEGLAGVVAMQGALRWTAQLWGAAEALREVTALPLWPADRAGYDQAVRVARKQLGEAAFTAAWQEGRAMTPEQALAAQGLTIISPLTKASPAYPTGLTAREVEVLRLVAQGLTNAQIAQQLTISLHTVNAHVRSIFNKLDVNSRNAVTRFAIEHKLI